MKLPLNLSLFPTFSLLVAVHAKAAKPNLILIFADDQAMETSVVLVQKIKTPILTE